MECKVKDCCRPAHYKDQRVCQMHYFRFMRNGTYDLIRSRKYRISNPAGYQALYIPDHPLASSNGYVYEHRKIVFNKYRYDLPDCENCGKESSWEGWVTHIDHIDNDVTNNNESNLRVLCNGCNVKRSDKPKHDHAGRHSITFDGETKTPAEWARDERVDVAGSTIVNRKALGMSDYDALFAPKKTHNGNQS